jgi:hypothetical protein
MRSTLRIGRPHRNHAHRGIAARRAGAEDLGMSTEPLTRTNAPTCPNCGARLLQPSVQGACAFCGCELAVAVPHAAPPALPGDAATLRARFERLAAHPSLPELLQRKPSASTSIFVGHGSGIVGALVFLGIAIAIPFAAGGPLAPFALVFVAVAIFVLARAVWGAQRFVSADVLAKPAAIVEQRTLVRDRGDNDSHTRYFVTLELQDGQRAEYKTTRKLSGTLARQDLGVAYLRDEHLIAFERLAV